ncbi:MAG: hypothetical protein G3M78_04320 [Candidatus Nitrohelix vancouverensis]|uniref:Methyltransferase domain-containing protein n=1 Tax=Candidatus Nitrohelix vancouverensis TaxID=2705534 RepID=A0A7T0C178_9BACT|nr:MAG: hypothetical protein G3M78_04320 [Candidatus Nitrohelix vancouverensis]
MFSTYLSIALLILVSGVALIALVPAFFGSPWHPLRKASIQRILDFSELKAGEHFYELGSGDGRVSISAARDFGAHCVGVEIDPIKVWSATWLAKRAGVAGQTRFLRQNFLNADVSQADVVYLYLTHQAMDRLLPLLEGQLKPSARIVCYRFCFAGRQADKVNADRNLFLYRMGRGSQLNAYS